MSSQLLQWDFESDFGLILAVTQAGFVNILVHNQEALWFEHERVSWVHKLESKALPLHALLCHFETE